MNLRWLAMGLGGMMHSVLASIAPTLYEIEIGGSAQSPQLQMPSMTVGLDQEYLFVFNNGQARSFVLQIGEFAQHITTYYLQGSPSVSQDSVNISPMGKVLWHWRAMKPGEFSFYVVDLSTLQKSEKQTVIIQMTAPENNPGDKAPKTAKAAKRGPRGRHERG